MNLDATFAALADPTRRAILARLARGETTVQDLAEPFTMSLPAISKHLKVLERAGLIVRSREAQWRPCRIEPRPLKDVDDWLDRYRRFFDESFDRLDAYLKTLQADESKAKQPQAKHPKVKQATVKRSKTKDGNKRDNKESKDGGKT
jgi:DNA-binding transcriptional ArsR family regulator